jgi:taurine dioxygenase
LPEPPRATLLYAVETPSAGGDTLFANLYRAYETLSEGMANMLSGLRVVNMSALNGIALRFHHLGTGSMEAKKPGGEILSADHPAIRAHPLTGRKALYVNPAHSAHFAGMSNEESRPILDFLFGHAIRPEFTCRFRWRSGSLAVWDNRCTLHCAINDYDGHRRVMRRVTIQGDIPV